MKKKIIILSIIVIVIILIIGGYVIVNKQRHDNDSKISNENTIEEIANLKEPDEIISNNIEDSKKESENNKEDSPTNLNVIKYFGYESSELVDTILDEIEKCANNNYILKDTMGDVTAPKLTLTEAQNNRKSYEKTINELISDTDIFQEIYFENNTLNFKCHFEELLNRLGLGTHMGVGINVDEEGIQIFTIN